MTSARTSSKPGSAVRERYPRRPVGELLLERVDAGAERLRARRGLPAESLGGELAPQRGELREGSTIALGERLSDRSDEPDGLVQGPPLAKQRHRDAELDERRVVRPLSHEGPEEILVAPQLGEERVDARLAREEAKSPEQRLGPAEEAPKPSRRLARSTAVHRGHGEDAIEPHPHPRALVDASSQGALRAARQRLRPLRPPEGQVEARHVEGEVGDDRGVGAPRPVQDREHVAEMDLGALDLAGGDGDGREVPEDQRVIAGPAPLAFEERARLGVVAGGAEVRGDAPVEARGVSLAEERVLLDGDQDLPPERRRPRVHARASEALGQPQQRVRALAVAGRGSAPIQDRERATDQRLRLGAPILRRGELREGYQLARRDERVARLDGAVRVGLDPLEQLPPQRARLVPATEPLEVDGERVDVGVVGVRAHDLHGPAPVRDCLRVVAVLVEQHRSVRVDLGELPAVPARGSDLYGALDGPDGGLALAGLEERVRQLEEPRRDGVARAPARALERPQVTATDLGRLGLVAVTAERPKARFEIVLGRGVRGEEGSEQREHQERAAHSGTSTGCSRSR